jgi:hypothetical protein
MMIRFLWELGNDDMVSLLGERLCEYIVSANDDENSSHSRGEIAQNKINDYH